MNHIHVVLFNATQWIFHKAKLFLQISCMFLFFHCAYKVKTGAEMKEANTVSVSDLH